MALARPPGGADFNMTTLAVRGSRFHNGVSRVHGGVTSRMLKDLWPQIPTEENPVDYVTNGVHIPTFLAPEWGEIFDRFLGMGWLRRLDDPAMWEQVAHDTGPDVLERAPVPQVAAPAHGPAPHPGAALPQPGQRVAPRPPVPLRRPGQSERAHHRLRAPLRDLQARRAALQRSRRAAAPARRSAASRRFRLLGQGASRRPARAGVHPHHRAHGAHAGVRGQDSARGGLRPPFRAASWCRASTCGSTIPCFRWRLPGPPA